MTAIIGVVIMMAIMMMTTITADPATATTTS
jgi:hypothetical protein